MHDLEHPFMDDPAMRRRKCRVQETPSRPRQREEMARQPACRWPSRGHHSELQRRDKNISLADAGDDGLAGSPDHPVRRQLPFMVRDDAGFLARNIDACYAAEAKAVGHRLDALDSSLQRHLVEKHIAGPLQRLDDIHGAVPVFEPAMESGVSEIHAAAATETRSLADNAGLKRRQRNNHLESRSRRIHAGGNAVQSGLRGCALRRRQSRVNNRPVNMFGS